MKAKQTFGLSTALYLCLFLLPLSASAFYNPTAGRWLSRDPIVENGFRAIEHGRRKTKEAHLAFVFVRNAPITSIDLFGLDSWIIDPPNPDINTVVCDGNGGFAVQLSILNDPVSLPCIKACMEKHEQSHIFDIKQSSPNICVGQPPGMCVGWMAEWPALTLMKQTERQGCLIEIDCLRRQRRSCTPTGCNSAIDERIKQVQDRIDRDLQ